MTLKPNYILMRANDEGDGFRGFAIGLDGCSAEGRTEEETLANLKTAIAAWRRPDAQNVVAMRRRAGG